MSSDGELLAAWQGGDQTAGEALFERYYPLVMRFFANKVGDDPMDLIQETFMACVSSHTRLRDRHSFRSFLFGIAYNQLKRYYAEKRTTEVPLDLTTVVSADLSPGPGTMLTQGLEQRLLLDALRRIPVEHQIVLELFYWEGYTSAQVAEVLEQPHGTIRSRLRAARHKLEEAIKAVANDPEVYESTLSDVESWAAKIRERFSAPAQPSSGPS